MNDDPATGADPDRVDASPTKRFFVSMLVRDIELADAIPDLLDNCIDGVHRVAGHRGSELYKGFSARIDLSGEMFRIVDNCGGMDRKTAQEVAFRMGRPDPSRDDDVRTVGVYGIGMKRAIFKMGQDAVVTSQHGGQAFEVHITPEWMADDQDWDLKLEQATEPPAGDGTTITVRQLREGVAASFRQATGFVADLRAKIASIYAIILDKGFAIYLNGASVKPKSLKLHAAQPGPAEGVRPYVWRGDIEGVQVRLAVGFRRQLAREAEVEEITEDEKAVRRSAEDAGWTVVCNDRIVLFNDRTERTGWGTMGVPAYHNQFISIAGIVSFETNHAEKLPVTTTKRNLDQSSMVYLKALEEMKKGLKKFTDFTNKWKGQEEETTSSFNAAPLVSVSDLLRDYGSDATATTARTGGQAFQPNLPQPPKENQRRRIVFFRNREDVERLARHFFDDPAAKPSEVGEAAFDYALGAASK